jgi:hypothetical protein
MEILGEFGSQLDGEISAIVATLIRNIAHNMQHHLNSDSWDGQLWVHVSVM